MSAGIRLLRRWAIAMALAWGAVGVLLVGNTKYQITGTWPETSAVLFGVAAVALVGVAIDPRSRRRLNVAVILAMLGPIYRATGILISDPPSAIPASGWIGIVVYTALAYCVGFIGVVFRLVQGQDQ